MSTTALKCMLQICLSAMLHLFNNASCDIKGQLCRTQKSTAAAQTFLEVCAACRISNIEQWHIFHFCVDTAVAVWLAASIAEAHFLQKVLCARPKYTHFVQV